MTEVISVRFKNKGKIYYFEPNGITASQGDHLIVETAKGLEFAECVSGNHLVDDSAVRPPLRPVVRIATQEDILKSQENRRREDEAFEICREKILKHGLDMKLVDVEYNFEGNKILFFFTSDGRVDFRDLVRDLASIFKTRIELRQIGVRDEARMLGGLGICGCPFCCSQFLDDFQPVSIKMAKTQGLSLNPSKISGTCGRLMCCLKYEQDTYEDLVKDVPKVDSFVETPAGKGSVLDVNLLKGTVRVRLEDYSDSPIRIFESDEVEVLGGKAKRAEYLAMKAEAKAEPERTAPKLKKSTPQPEAASPQEEKPSQVEAAPRRRHRGQRPSQKQDQQRSQRSEQPRIPRPEQSKSHGKPNSEPIEKGDSKSRQEKPQGTSHEQSKPRTGHRRKSSRRSKKPNVEQTPQGEK